MDYTIIIKEIRNKLFLTQTELAEKLGVSLAAVCRWEKGTYEPNANYQGHNGGKK